VRHKNNFLRKIEFLKNNNAEVITYHTCQFHQNILSKNKAMAVKIQKCTSLSEQLK